MNVFTAALLLGLVASSYAAEEKPKDEGPKCKWLPDVEGRRNSGNEAVTLRDISLEDCKAKMEEYDNTIFKSIEYYKPTKICYLQKVDRHTTKLNLVDANYVYAEIDCGGNFPDECQWEEVKGSYIGSTSLVTLTVVTVDLCKEACEKETTFHCKGFDYLTTNKYCYLKLVSRYGLKLNKHASYNHYERNCYDKYRGCRFAEEGNWASPKRGFYPSGTYSNSLTSTTVDQCKTACIQETDYYCMAIAFDHTGNSCRLMNTNTQMGGASLSENAAWDFYELESCPQAEPAKQPTRNCKWMKPVQGYISGNDKKTLSGQTMDQCKKSCENEEDFACNSFDYLVSSKNCYLQSVNRFTHTVSMHSSYVYNELDCSADFPEECEWEAVKENKYISGNDLKTLTGMTPETCKTACENEQTFHCVSFDFLKTHNYCYLARVNMYNVIPSDHVSYDFYERSCKTAYKTCSGKNPATWAKPKIGRYLSGYDLRTIYKVDVDECKEACLQTTDFHCTSFDYTRSNRYCYLQGVNTKDYALLVSANYEYHEIVSCGGKRPTPPEPVEEKCARFVGPVKGTYLSGYDKKTISNVASVEQCQKECVEATDFDCLSFDHYPAAKRCYLNYGDRNVAKLSASTAYDYYEKKCDSDPFPEDCDWEPARKGRYLSGQDFKTVYNIENPTQCKEQCENEWTFNCISFDYHAGSKFCYLSLKDMYTTKLVENAAYTYYERNCKDQFRYCSRDSVQDAIWEGPFHGHYINTQVQTNQGVDDAEDCKRLCLEASLFHCASFYYYEAAKYCYLSLANRESGKMLANANYVYYELVSCPAPEDEGREGPDPVECKWLPARTGKYISGNDNLVLRNVDVTSCKKACEEAVSFTCLSFDIYGTTCYLSIKDRRTVTLSSHASYTYYERDCSTTFPEQCEWQEVVNRRYISGNDAKTLNTMSVADCKEACEDEQDFHCVSFDYYRPSERCYLQRADLYSSFKLSTHNDYDYYERNCYDKFRSCGPHAEVTWDGPYSGHHISGNDLYTLTGIELDECKQACKQQEKFHCRSFEYSNKNKYCYLQAANREFYDLTMSVDRDYYEVTSCNPSADVTAEKKPLKYKWVQKRGYYLPGNDKKTLYNYDVEDCKKECEESKAFKCTSFDYLVAHRYCYLQAANRFGGLVLSASISYEYYEMDFEDNYPEGCKWEGPFGATYIGGQKKSLTDVTEEECKTACEEEETFHCRAFDFYLGKYCYLNPLNRYDKITNTNANYIFYERNCKAKHQECKEGAAVAWNKPKRGVYLNGYDLKTLTTMEVDECKEACMQETRFHCRSFDYHRQSKYCRLQAAVMEELTVDFTESGAFDYYEIERCETVEEKKRATDGEEEESADGCQWVGPVNNAYMHSYDKKTLTGVTAGDCMKACENELSFNCMSFDYNLNSRLCYLSDKDRTSVKLTVSGSYQYFERACDKNFPDQCSWEGPVKGGYLHGYDTETLRDMSVESCKSACESSCYYRCVSFDYVPSSRICYLSMSNRYTAKLSTNANYEYYERNCNHEFDACNHDAVGDWYGPRYGKTLSGFVTHQTINSQTEEECKAACQDAELFHCQSFIYRRVNGQCLLSAVSTDTKVMADSLDYNYYELNGCEGETAPLDITEPEECVPEDFYVSTCACSGDPHCLSFDGKWVHFQGTCFLTAARDNCANGVPTAPPTWEIISNPNAPTPTYPVSYVRSAQVNLHSLGLTIGIYPGYATVNGVRVPGSPMYYADKQVKIQITSAVYVTVKGAFQVIFQDSYLQIKLVTDLREKVCGLCGNFNGDQSDDWTIGNSKYCMSKYPNAVTGEITHDTNVMGTSWTNKLEEADQKCLNECPNPPHPTGCENEEAFKAEDHCDILQNMNAAFKTCLSKMSEAQRAEIFDNCVYDSCSLDNYEDIVCRHAKSLARMCVDQFNIPVTWRNTNFCPMECGENMEYKPCGDPCMPSCSDIKGENCGDLGPCGEGCFCKSGHVFDGKKCIPQSSCGCQLESLGIFINVGESYTPTDCSTKCTCESAGADLTCVDMTCSDNYVCGTSNGIPACVCEAPFVLDGAKCVDLPNPCVADAEGEESDVLTCLTCDAENDEECEEAAMYQTCTGDDPICRVEYTKAANGNAVRVVRGCAQRKDCMPEAIGEGVEYCEDEMLGRSKCHTCNFDLGEEDDVEKSPAQCAEPVAPTEPPVEDPCTMTPQLGTGDSKETRYYFDAKTQECNKFKYTGQGGNDNNFKTIDACFEQCGEPKPDFCELPKVVGNAVCDGKKAKSKKAFFFDSKKGSCKKFKYTGCGGNENNFKSKKACAKACQN